MPEQFSGATAPTYLKVTDVADLLQISKDTARRLPLPWIDIGRNGRKRLRVSLSAVEEYLASRTEAAQ